MTKLIGITGGTGCGKTTLVNKIIERLAENEVVVIPQDAYYKDLSYMPAERRRSTNFDHPDAFDWALMLTHIDALMHGQPIDRPVYDYATSSRTGTVRVLPCRVIIIEGIMAFHDEVLRDMMHLRIYVDAPADERLLRVIERDTRERDLSIAELIPKYRNSIKPMHDRYIEPMKQYAHIILQPTEQNSVAVDMLTQYISDTLATSTQHSL